MTAFRPMFSRGFVIQPLASRVRPMRCAALVFSETLVLDERRGEDQAHALAVEQASDAEVVLDAVEGLGGISMIAAGKISTGDGSLGEAVLMRG